MSMGKLFSTMFGLVVGSMLGVPANAQMAERAAREQAVNLVRSQLHLEAGQFLRVQRDEPLEQLLAVAVSKASWAEFIYRVSQAGDDIKENTIVHHIFTDTDPTYIIAVSPANGTAYRIQGFSDSMAEFDKLMTAANVRVSNTDQAEAVAEFYRAVNPQHHSLTPILSLIQLKQAAERQCQTSSFETGEAQFNAWWKSARPQYADLPFRQTAARIGSGYAVEWIVLSSPGHDLCGGAPLRARLQIGSNGQVGGMTFTPLRTANTGVNHEAGHVQAAAKQ